MDQLQMRQVWVQQVKVPAPLQEDIDSDLGGKQTAYMEESEGCEEGLVKQALSTGDFAVAITVLDATCGTQPIPGKNQDISSVQNEKDKRFELVCSCPSAQESISDVGAASHSAQGGLARMVAKIQGYEQ